MAFKQIARGHLRLWQTSLAWPVAAKTSSRAHLLGRFQVKAPRQNTAPTLRALVGAGSRPQKKAAARRGAPAASRQRLAQPSRPGFGPPPDDVGSPPKPNIDGPSGSLAAEAGRQDTREAAKIGQLLPTPIAGWLAVSPSGSQVPLGAIFLKVFLVTAARNGLVSAKAGPDWRAVVGLMPSWADAAALAGG
jgi:hypothetical protein